MIIGNWGGKVNLKKLYIYAIIILKGAVKWVYTRGLW
jgi:hypothetical protein